MIGQGDDARRNRDEDLKPGSPPRPATEPHGAADSSRTPKTDVDPATGEPQPGAPQPAASVPDEPKNSPGRSD